MRKEIIDALKPYDYYYLVSACTIGGPGPYIVVFASTGDYYCACLDAEYKVLWCKPLWE